MRSSFLNSFRYSSALGWPSAWRHFLYATAAFLIQRPGLLDQVGQGLEILEAAPEFWIRDQPFKALLRRMCEELLCLGYVLVGGETKAIEDLSHLVVRVLHLSREGSLRIAREQLCLARLLEGVLNRGALGIEANRFRRRRVSWGLNRLDRQRVNKLHTRLAQCSVDCSHVVGAQITAGKGLVNHFKREIAPLGGQPQQFDYPLRDIQTGFGFEELD